MKNVNKFLSCLGVALACFTVASSAAYAAVAGHVQFVNGDVQIVSPAGQARPLQKGDAVNEGDTLTSAPAASAQIRMQDGGFVAMRPDTSLKFDQFVFSGKQDGSEKSFFSLFKGGFRAVTGLIGQINKQNYKITTPAATIGIRGTDHETMLITPGSPLALVAPAGAYSKVNVGETTLTTNRGVINVMPNQMGFAGGMDQAPKLQPLNTGIFTVAPAPAVRAEKKEDKKEAKTEAKQEQKTAKSEEKKEGGEKSKQESAATESKPASTEQAASTSSEKAAVAAAPQETAAPIRSAAAVDAVAPAAGLIPVAVAPVVAVPVVVAPVIAPPTVQTVPTAATGGTTVNITTGTATTSTGQVIPVTQSMAATQSQAAADAALLAANAAQAAATTAAQTNATLAVIATVPVTSATAAIGTATSSIGTASTAVTSAAALAPVNAAATGANAAAAQTAASVAAAQSAAAQAALTANGAFADATAAPANTALLAANTALQTANTAVQSAATTVTAQNTALTAAQAAAVAALTTANTNLTTANTSLAAANTQNSVISIAQGSTAAQVSAAQTAAVNAQAAATAAQTAATLAASLQAAGDLAGAQGQLLIAQQQLAVAQTEKTAALAAQTTVANQLAAAQTAATAAGAAVTVATNAAVSAAANATTASTQSVAAQTASANANTAVTTVNTNLATLNANVAIVATNAPVAAYNNPAVVTTNRFVGVLSTVKPDAVSGYVEGYGPGAGFTGGGTANTSFVLDGAGNLLESRHAWYEETAASTATPQIVLSDANIKRSGGTAVETYRLADNSIYGGRWQGGSITVTDNALINPVATFNRNLGVTSEHWAILLAPPAGYVQTLTGVSAYTKVNATSPTDALGNAGVLNSASLTANFTSMLVDAALNLTIVGKNMGVAANGMPVNGSSFSTSAGVTATCTGCAGTYYANVGGGFAGNAAASAGLSYTLWTGQAPGSTAPATDLIQGMVAFSTAAAPAVAPAQAYVQTDVAVETSVNNGYAIYYGPLFYSGNSMTAAANVAPLANPPSFTINYGCFSCGTDTVTLPGAAGAVNGNANSFATTGIQFGRWTSAPSISQTSTYTFAPGQNNIGNSSSGWTFAPGGYLDTPTVLSAATGGTNAMGVFNYALNGAPAPRDQNGTAGTLNSLSLAANFTTQTVTAALSASLGATTWTANSAAMGIYAANFGGTLTVTSNAVCAVPPCVNMGGYLSGAFTGQNYAGAIVGYNIYQSPLAGGAMSTNLYGVAALTRNGVAGNAVVANGTAAPTGNFVVAESGSMSGSFVQTANTATATGGVLTGYSSTFGAGNTSSTSIVCTTCTGQAAADTATGIQYGTWDAGSRTYSYTSPFGGQFHWIKGAGLDPVYLPEVLTGTMTYALDGGTAPTNQHGVAGSLGSASLNVNFTSQTVDVALGLTGVNGHGWTASSTGAPLNWTNYSKNGFWASSGTTQGGVLSVSMDGATAGTGYLSGQLTGSGLNGALFQYQLSAPLPMPTVPGTFIATDMVTVQAPSVTVTGPVTTVGTVSVAFPAGASGTLTVQPATTLNVALSAGVPVSATLTGGINASVPALTADLAKQGVYYGTAASGESVSVATSGYLVGNSGLTSGLKYSNFGEWRMLPTPLGVAPVTATGPFTSGEFAGGMLPTSTMPTGGFAVNGNYYGAIVGGAQDGANNTPYSLSNGWLAVNANFTTGTLSGSATNIQVHDQSTGGFSGYFNDLSLAGTIATNSFSGSVTANAIPAGTTASPVNLATGTVGTTSGHFYGPNANELTGIFGLVSGTIKASGAFGAANGTSNSTPFETVNGTVALATAAPANTATPYRLIGMSAYDPAAGAFNGGMVLDGGYNNATRVAADVAGNLTAFDGSAGILSVNNNASTTLAIGTAAVAGLGTDPVSGISWGRWVGGSISITDRTTGVVNTAGNAGSLHWIAGPSMTAPVALPTTGTYTYVLAGGTAPADNLGNVGTLNSASLVANFTTQTVNVGVNVGINNVSGAATLNASANNVPIQQRSMFAAQTAGMAGGSSGLLNATCTGAGCSASPIQANVGGAFTGATGQGAAMTYGFNNGGTVINGVAAFHR